VREGGVQALYRSARRGGDPLAIAVIAWEYSGVARQPHPALTARRRKHLLRYCGIADRMFGQGEGARYLLDVMLGHGRCDGREVCSLDFFVCDLRSWVRATRRGRRGRPPIPHERAGWYVEREERRAVLAAFPKRRRRR
jgi:hypothetical protein